MKTIVFIFVPVYVDKNIDAPVRVSASAEFRKVRRILFSRPRRAEPFWTWFIDNPRPPSAHQQ